MLSMGPLPARLVRTALASLAASLALGREAPAATTGLTLAEAVTRALHEGREAKIAALETARADDAAGAARSVYWPHAAIESQAGWSNRQNDTLDAIDGQGVLKRYPLSTLGSNAAWLSVYIDQTVFDLSQWRGVERTELEAEAAAVAEAEQRDRIAFTVLERYLAVLRLEALAALDAQQLEGAEWLDRQAGLLFESGRAIAAEREQAELHLDEAQLRVANRRAELAEARAALATVIGESEPSAADLPLAADSLPATDSVNGDSGDEEVLRGAPELRILDLRRRMEETSLAAARAERFPTLSVRGGYFHYGTKRFDSFEDELAVGVDLKVSVFNGFRTSNAIEGASKAAEAARLRYDAVRESKRVRVRELTRRLAALEQQQTLAERRAGIARDRQRLADLSLQAQRGSLAQTLASRADVARDASAAVEARMERVLVWATLQRETGRLAALLTGDGGGQP
jgi:outer membrane protein TolC